MNQVVCAAIASRRLLRFRYEGRERIVEPHGHGCTSAGLEIIIGFQVDGQSRLGPVCGWKMFHLPKMVDIRELGQFARPRPDYHPAKLRITTLCCHLNHAQRYITK